MAEEKKPVKTKKVRQAKSTKKVEFPNKYWIVSADFSLRRPGFFSMHVTRNEDGSVELTKIKSACVDNKTDKLKSHGEILDEIFYALGDFKPHIRYGEGAYDPIFYVREHAFNARGAMSEMGIFEVVGVSNFWAYQHGKAEWHEIYPVTVKKLITGNAKAQKSQVENCVVKYYTPDHTYQNDDESDAAAIAFAWLIQNGQIKPAIVPETKQAKEKKKDE